MRIILYTGKGGVGKTSVAAATAVHCAAHGARTVVLSADPAHSLADSLDLPLGAEPVEIAPKLWGQETDIFYNMQRHWGTIQGWLRSVLAWRGLDAAMSEEIAVLPGMEELANLLWINEHALSGRYDVLVVDCAPTGETLRLLTFPEIGRWWLEKILPLQRRVAKVVHPILRPIVDIPLPEEAVLDAAEDLFRRLDRLHKLLSGPDASVRIVLNPEKMVIKESQRTLTHLNLYQYQTDLVICNRVLPEQFDDSYFKFWKDTQQRYLQTVEESFAPIPIVTVPWFEQEVVGLAMLRRMGDALYQEHDPTAVHFRGRSHTIRRDGDGYSLRLPLPLAQKEQIGLHRSGDELIVRIGAIRRNIVLPYSVGQLEVAGARFEEDTLVIRFAGDREGAAQQAPAAGGDDDAPAP